LLIGVVEPYACSAPAREGGRIFLNTGEFLACENIDEIAGVMSHEIGHIIARHVTERNAAAALARGVAQLFGWNAALGSDLISWRVRTLFFKPDAFKLPSGDMLIVLRPKREKQTTLASY
jgi:Zn-dependent protease with chaperone function